MTVVLLALFILLYLLFERVLDPDRLAGAYAAREEPPPLAWAGAIVLRRLGGLALLGGGAVGLLLAFGRDPLACGVQAAPWDASLLWVAGAAAAAAPILLRKGRGADTQAHYPELAVLGWRPGIRVLSALSWALFLLGYEFLFRGAMLFELRDAWGDGLALAVVTALYALAHWRHGRGEVLACVPLGLIFGLMTLHTGAIWAAWALHLVILMVLEHSAAWFNPAIAWGRED